MSHKARRNETHSPFSKPSEILFHTQGCSFEFILSFQVALQPSLSYPFLRDHSNNCTKICSSAFVYLIPHSAKPYDFDNPTQPVLNFQQKGKFQILVSSQLPKPKPLSCQENTIFPSSLGLSSRKNCPTTTTNNFKICS